MTTYGMCECGGCYKKIPKNEAHHFVIDKERGHSGGSFRFGSRGPSYYTGRTYYAKRDVWLCAFCYAAHVAEKERQKRNNLIVLAVVTAVIFSSAIYSSIDVSSNAPQPATGTANSVSVPAQHPMSRGPLDANDIVRVQKRLSELGYLTAPVDGVWGQKSRTALRTFKEAHGLPKDDTWDETVGQALFSAAATRAPMNLHGRNNSVN